MKFRVLLLLLSVFMISGCGTKHFVNVERDKLTGENVCSVTSLQQRDYVTTGNPGQIILVAHHDFKLYIGATHFYPLLVVNGTDNLKSVKIRVDSNEIITIDDNNPKDDIFFSENEEGLINQMISG